MRKIHVSNLPSRVTERELEDLFSDYGTVESVIIITDRETDASKGYASVEMSDGVDEAIRELKGMDFQGKTLYLTEEKTFGSHDQSRYGHQKW